MSYNFDLINTNIIVINNLENSQTKMSKTISMLEKNTR